MQVLGLLAMRGLFKGPYRGYIGLCRDDIRGYKQFRIWGEGVSMLGLGLQG